MKSKLIRLGFFCSALLWVLWADRYHVDRPSTLAKKSDILALEASPLLPLKEVEPSIKMEPNSQIESFKVLSSKVLMTAEEKTKLQELLANPDLIRKSYLSLVDTASHERERFLVLDYLEKAVAWEENPSREQVLESLKNAMLIDNISHIQDLSLRKSYAGDKVEIYAILKQYAPEALDIIDTLPEDGRIKKLLAYAENLSKF